MTTTLNYPQILQTARQLPASVRWQLVEALVTEIEPKTSPPRLIPLFGLSRLELQVMAQVIVAPDHQKELQALLAKSRINSLKTDEQTRLDDLLTEIDQVALLKARAMYTLQKYGDLLQ
ncbi:hypothetical protein QUF63_13625 [Anaerolineales bacterium HSG25]|nr:hypothetical protein [Anaerolineales bacterium HSG25]